MEMYVQNIGRCVEYIQQTEKKSILSFMQAFGRTRLFAYLNKYEQNRCDEVRKKNTI